MRLAAQAVWFTRRTFPPSAAMGYQSAPLLTAAPALPHCSHVLLPTAFPTPQMPSSWA